jgi:hypothetical protein
MIVVEDKDAFVGWIDFTAHPRISRTQIAIFDVARQWFWGVTNCLAAPGTILPVRGDNHPLFA